MSKSASTKVDRVHQGHKAQKNPYGALQRVQEFYPEVRSVVDADEKLAIEVTPKDCASKAVKNHRECAMAVAVKRSEHADGAIISKNTAYVIKGDKAYRYKVPQSVAREVVSFDRKGGFEPGTYMLRQPTKTERLGGKETGDHSNEGIKRNKTPKFYHVTTNVRTRIGAAGIA